VTEGLNAWKSDAQKDADMSGVFLHAWIDGHFRVLKAALRRFTRSAHWAGRDTLFLRQSRNSSCVSIFEVRADSSLASSLR